MPAAEAPRLPALPPRARALVEEYEQLRELGASKTVRMINEVLAILATEGEFASAAETVAAVRQAADYFRLTRGTITPAVGNALGRVLKGLEGAATGDRAAVVGFIRERTEAFNRQSLQNTARIARFAAELIAEARCVLAYDYSGTVVAALRAAADAGTRLRVIVPESRTLDGGRPIVDQVVAWGHTANFIADAVIADFMPQAEAVLEGVETLTAGGDFLGTPGTFTVALLAKHFGVPFYALTETLKIDPATLHGPPPTVARRWLADVFDHPRSFSRPGAVSVDSPGLERVPADLVTAYVTEAGSLTPQAIRPIAERMLAEGP